MSSSAETRPSCPLRLGQIIATPGALAALERAGQSSVEFLKRHANDWGLLCPEDHTANEQAVANEGDLDRQTRVLSAYRTTLGEKIWIITEADRSSSTLLLPEEY